MAAWHEPRRDPLRVVVCAALLVTLALFGGAWVFWTVLDAMLGRLP